MATKTDEMPGLTGKGVELLSIKAIDNAISKYEDAKERRCKMSPREVAAKGELLEVLHKNRDKLPLNEDWHPFYRADGVDYVLQEMLKRSKAQDGPDEE
jgi:hypothetical protein